MTLAAYTASNELPKAVAFAEQWLEEQPESQLAHISRARVAVSQGNTDDAMGFLDRAADLAPEDPTPLVAAGNVALQKGDNKEASERFKAALERAPDNAPALAGITRVLSDEELSRYMESLAKQHPDAMGPEVILLQIALKRGNLEDAERRTGQLIEAAETADNDELRALLPRLYQNVAIQASENDPDLSQRVLQRGRSLFPEHEQITLTLATLAFQKGQHDTARSLLQDAKRLHPESAGPFITEANYLAGRGDHLPAAELYQLALGKERTVATELAAARSFLRAGQREKSRTLLEDAITAFPDRPELFVNVAMVYQSDGLRDKAQKAYEDALELSSDNIVALNNLAWLHYEAGDIGKAIDLARRAFGLSPQNPSVADTYGWIMLKSGNLDESLTALQRAHDLSPDSREIALHLAEAYRAAGRESEATRLMEKFGDQG
jgi:tetratricopeptide (TPR) repeat protein